MQYLNNNKIQRILSFPDEWYISLNTLYKSELKREFDIDKRIKIILVKENNSKNKFVEQQLINNNIFYIKTPINDLFNVLDKVQSKYVLVMFEGDFIISDNLDKSFIDDFENRFKDTNNLKILFAGQSINIPEINIENSDNLKNPGINKYLNGNLIFGDRIEILKYFQIFKEIVNNKIDQFSKEPLPYNIYLQLLHRFIFVGEFIPITINKDLDYKNIDYSNNFFTTILENEQDVVENDGIRYVKYNYTYNERLI